MDLKKGKEKRFGKLLTRIADKHGLSQHGVASLLSMHYSYVSYVMAGKRNAFAESEIKMLCEKLGLNDEEKVSLYEAASFDNKDKCPVPYDIVDYIRKTPALREMIRVAIKFDLKDDFWKGEGWLSEKGGVLTLEKKFSKICGVK